MAVDDEFEVLAQTCIANHELILTHGSSEMQAASRILLYALAEEIRRREAGFGASTGEIEQEPTEKRRESLSRKRH